MKKTKRSNIANILYIALLVIIVAIKFIDIYGDKPDNNDETIVNTSVATAAAVTNDDVKALLSRIEIKDGKNYDTYDREKWTSKYQKYVCNNRDHTGDGIPDCDGTYTSIRKYSFYESEWYDWTTNTYTDPYTGKAIKDVKKTDYDHIIPLMYVYTHGGANWSEEKSKEFADDPTVGVCCTQFDNRAKGAKAPSEWLPTANIEDYCYTWLVIADRFDLWLEQADYDVIVSVLANYDGELSLINDLHN